MWVLKQKLFWNADIIAPVMELTECAVYQMENKIIFVEGRQGN